MDRFQSGMFCQGRDCVDCCVIHRYRDLLVHSAWGQRIVDAVIAIIVCRGSLE